LVCSYIRLYQLTAAHSASPSPLQLKCLGNAVVSGIVYLSAYQAWVVMHQLISTPS
jgi:hypothetical protein